MAFSYKKLLNGINIVGKALTQNSELGDLEVLTSDNKLYFFDGTINSPVVTETGSGTISGKTFDNNNFIDNTSFFIDEVDNTKRFIFDAAPVTTGTTRTLAVPNANTTLVGIDVVQTLTNKTIDADLNTITNIDNADIKVGANIARSKLASGTANGVVYNDGSGVMTDSLNLLFDGDVITIGGAGNTDQHTSRGPLIVTAPNTSTGTVPLLHSQMTGGAFRHLLYLDHSAVGDSQNYFFLRAFNTAGDRLLIYGDGQIDLPAGGPLRFGDSGFFVGFEAPTLAASTTFRLPPADGTVNQVLKTDGAGNLAFADANSNLSDASYDDQNLGIAATVAGNALTIAIKTKTGVDASGASPVRVGFRNLTSATGTYNIRNVIAALSMTASSGSTLGTASGVDHYLYVYLLDNAGTVELAVSMARFDEGTVRSTTAEGGAGAADLNRILYSTTARVNVPIRLVGRLKVNQPVAGTWTVAPSEISLRPFDRQHIAARATINTAPSVPNNSDFQVMFNTKIFDTHNSYSTSTGLFTCPESGKYRITCAHQLQNANWDLGERFFIKLLKNASTQYRLDLVFANTSASYALASSGSGILECVAGDELRIDINQDSGAAVNLSADVNSNWISFEKVGEL